VNADSLNGRQHCLLEQLPDGYRRDRGRLSLGDGEQEKLQARVEYGKATHLPHARKGHY
jgi:hypothetical protein